MSFIEVKQKKETYEIWFKVWCLIDNNKTKENLLRNVLEVREKKEMLKKEKKIFSKQFVTTEPTKYGLRKKTF